MKKYIIILLVALGFLSSCNHRQEKTSWDYMGDFDMYYSKAYESYTADKHFKNGITLQKPVEGTMAREWTDYEPYPFKDKFGDKVKAGQVLHNPFPASKENIAIGKMKYDVYCALCHGFEGKADGSITKVKNAKGNKAYMIPPANLTTDVIQSKPDGEIYHVITMGSAVMGAHASQISPDDRWKIILYIKNGLKK